MKMLPNMNMCWNKSNTLYSSNTLSIYIRDDIEKHWKLRNFSLVGPLYVGKMFVDLFE